MNGVKRGYHDLHEHLAALEEQGLARTQGVSDDDEDDGHHEHGKGGRGAER